MTREPHGREPRSRHPARPSLLGLALLLASLPCAASLGGAPSPFAGGASVRHAQTLAAASAASTAGAAAYDVRTTVLEGGTTVREYVANGVVFAVAWSGQFQPDLRALLGQHFTTLTAETAKRPHAGRSQVHIAQGGVTIESTGHMRAHAGRAWVASLLPAGFDTDDIE